MVIQILAHSGTVVNPREENIHLNMLMSAGCMSIHDSAVLSVAKSDRRSVVRRQNTVFLLFL